MVAQCCCKTLTLLVAWCSEVLSNTDTQEVSFQEKLHEQPFRKGYNLILFNWLKNKMKHMAYLRNIEGMKCSLHCFESLKG